jgi:pyrimidine-nucleoside phosphorylase
MNESKMRQAIERKREGEHLSPVTWDGVISGYMDGSIGDEQMAALLMACVWRGLSMAEATALTRAMVESGATIAYPDGTFVVDKHSSGGVSDVVSLVAVPLVAACGVPVAKLSGRALGHTGGTIDKLETIPGFNVSPSIDAFTKQVQRVGCAIAAQSDAFVPADKRLYTLRDRTATVPSIGLIAASIVSKKVAGGAHAFVFDVKCGNGAFMRDAGAATDLAQALVAIASGFDRKARAVVTDMNEPLGRFIGTALEVIEAREFLNGNSTDPRTLDGCLRIAAEMLELAGVEEAHSAAVDALRSGSAYEKFAEMIDAQGGSVDAMERLEPAEATDALRAARGGYVSAVDTVALGHAARELSAHDDRAGIRVNMRIGDVVNPGDVLADVYGGRHHVSLGHAFTIEDAPPARHPFVSATI